MDAYGMPTQSYLERYSLPARMLEVPDIYVDESRFWRLTEDLIAREAIEDFGHRVGKGFTIEQIGDPAQYLLRQPSLYSSLKRFCEIASLETQISQFSLFAGDTHLWFMNSEATRSSHRPDTIELYDLQLMQSLVRAALGADWLPAKVRLRAASLPSGLPEEALSCGGIEYNSMSTGIAIPTDLLSRPMPSYSTAIDDGKHLEVESGYDLPAQLRRLLRGYVDESFGLEELAELTFMSTRTLQRRLSECGTSYRVLQELARFDIALAMLNSSERNITDIGFELGYSSPTSFSRAFHNWTGVSPTRYRKSLNSDS